MEIVIVATKYCTPNRPVHIFLDNVVREMADRGTACTVIAPQSLYSRIVRRRDARPYRSKRVTSSGNPYSVYSPLFMVYPGRRMGIFPFPDWSQRSFYRAVKRTYQRRKLKADAIYSHFFQAGFSAVRLARRLRVPSFIANGEADTLKETKRYTARLVTETLEGVTGIISVSSKNKEEIGRLCGGKETVLAKVRVIPNAVDGARFHGMDQAACRRALGFPEAAFIVIFTGSFIHRKGSKRLADTLDRMEGVCSIFIGSGPEKPECKNILFCGRVDNAHLCEYLNAADVFVLPTLAEGCSNAIVEALACGLPVISSDRSFNHDILNDSCAILIDPDNEKELEDAIRMLQDSKQERERLHSGSVGQSRELKLEKRVDAILQFIREALA